MFVFYIKSVKRQTITVFAQICVVTVFFRITGLTLKLSQLCNICHVTLDFRIIPLVAIHDRLSHSVREQKSHNLIFSTATSLQRPRYQVPGYQNQVFFNTKCVCTGGLLVRGRRHQKRYGFIRARSSPVSVN